MDLKKDRFAHKNARRLRSGLRRVFSRHALPVTLFSVAVIGTIVVKDHLDRQSTEQAADTCTTTPLTAGEIALSKKVFGSALDTRHVTKVFCKNAHNDQPPVEIRAGHEIVFHGADTWSPDFSKEKNVIRYGFFMHDLTHLWQQQTGAPIKPCETLGYTLTPERPFSAYCSSHQALMVEDYARLHLFKPAHQPRGTADTPANNALLTQTIEKAFPQARLTRENKAAASP